MDFAATCSAFAAVVKDGSTHDRIDVVSCRLKGQRKASLIFFNLVIRVNRVVMHWEGEVVVWSREGARSKMIDVEVETV
eukprot:scaffold3283_cov103-Alexandrium_tamarense.AAC.32